MIENETSEAYFSAIEVYDCVNKLLPIVDRMRRELVGLMNDAQDMVIQKVEKGGLELVDPKEWNETLHKRQSRSLLALSSAYRTFTDGPICDSLPIVEMFPANGISVIKTLCNTSMTVVDNMLITKTPVLFRRTKTFISQRGKSFCIDYHDFFSPEIYRLLNSFDGKLPMFRYKNMAVFSVYSKQKSIIPDAENLDTKSAIDAIVSYQPTSDSGEFCSFSSLCFRSDEIQEGAYFILSEGFGKVPSYDETVELLKRMFPVGHSKT